MLCWARQCTHVETFEPLFNTDTPFGMSMFEVCHLPKYLLVLQNKTCAGVLCRLRTALGVAYCASNGVL